MCTDTRPWGHFTVIKDDSDFKVKTITVNPGQRLSLQSHKKRNEHWIVVIGTVIVTLGDKTETCGVNSHVYVPVNGKHRIENPGDAPAVVVEIQTGDYFGEDDIVRYEDDYNRQT